MKFLNIKIIFLIFYYFVFSCFININIGGNIINYDCIENFTSKNQNKENSFFTFGDTKINFSNEDNNNFIFSVEIKKNNIPSAILFELCYKFGSEDNKWNSEISDSNKVFKNNTFQINVPKNIFYDQNTNTISSMSINFNLHFIAWDPVSKEYTRWDDYLEIFKINLSKLLGIENEIKTLNKPYNLSIPEDITINNVGKIINHEEIIFYIKWNINIQNYLLSDICDITTSKKLNFLSITGYVYPDNTKKFSIKRGDLKTECQTTKTNDYHVGIYQKTYFDPVSKITYTYPKSSINDARSGLIIPYYDDISLNIYIQLKIETFLNVSLNIDYYYNSLGIFSHDSLHSIFKINKYIGITTQEKIDKKYAFDKDEYQKWVKKGGYSE